MHHRCALHLARSRRAARAIVRAGADRVLHRQGHELVAVAVGRAAAGGRVGGAEDASG